MKKNTRGFTLIELLVVIAIIGILASIVLVSLNSARKKGNDTRVVADVQQIRTLLETGYNGASYPDLVSNATSTSGPGAASLAIAWNDAFTQGGAIQVFTNGATATQYAIFGRLVSDSTKYFCIDSAGRTAQAVATGTPTISCS